jgi:hypothetical protein
MMHARSMITRCRDSPVPQPEALAPPPQIVAADPPLAGGCILELTPHPTWEVEGEWEQLKRNNSLLGCFPLTKLVRLGGPT